MGAGALGRRAALRARGRRAARGRRPPGRSASACSPCAGRTRSRSTPSSRCSPPRTRSRSAASSRSRSPRSARRSPAATRWTRPRPDRRERLRDAPARGAQGARIGARARAARRVHGEGTGSVRANRAYRLIHTRGSRAPAFLAGPGPHGPGRGRLDRRRRDRAVLGCQRRRGRQLRPRHPRGPLPAGSRRVLERWSQVEGRRDARPVRAAGRAWRGGTQGVARGRSALAAVEVRPPTARTAARASPPGRR